MLIDQENEERRSLEAYSPGSISRGGGSLYQFSPKNGPIPVYYHPPTLAFLPEGQKILAILRKKVPKMAIFSPFLAFFDHPPILLPPPYFRKFSQNVHPLHLLHPPY